MSDMERFLRDGTANIKEKPRNKGKNAKPALLLFGNDVSAQATPMRSMLNQRGRSQSGPP
jgi:hypothetical protein